MLIFSVICYIIILTEHYKVDAEMQAFYLFLHRGQAVMLPC